MRALPTCILLAHTALSGFTASANQTQPNILVIITDDQRHDMLGAVTPHLVTPEMDRLATQGVHFRNAFVTTSICAASRASILTGLHERTHRFTFITPPLAERFVDRSYPVLLRQAGYRTGYVGKFGVKTNPGATSKLFDTFEPLNRNPYWKTQKDGTRRHLTDITADRAVDFIVANDARPFCLTIGFNAPHAEDVDPQQYFWPPSADALYKDLRPKDPPTSEPEFYDNLHPYLRDGTMNRDRWQWRFNFGPKRRSMTRGYYRMISGVDRAIGRIRKSLRAAEAAANTVILLIGDNGYFLGERGYAGKWLPHEPSIRVPLLLFDPRVDGARRGIAPTEMALNIDLAPTILDLANVPTPASMQGRSLLSLARGETPLDWRKDIFIEHLMMHPRIRKHEGVRTERYKYTRYFEAVPVFEELYDLDTDPHETTNLILNPDKAEVARALRQRTDELRDQYGGEFSARLWKEPR